jgi:antitoxin component of MazEF toxin-antitoxin module
MVKKLTKHGNSYALVIDKPIMDILKITPNTPLSISTDGTCLVVAPSKPPRRRKFKRALDKVNREWHDVLARLAK